MAVLYRDPHAPEAPAAYSVASTGAEVSRLLQGDTDAWMAAHAIAWGPQPYATVFRALWSPAALHLRFDARDDGPWHTMTHRDDHLWEQEVVEIFIDPPRRAADYLEIEISPANVVCDLRVRRPWPALAGDVAWNFDGLETRVRPWPESGGRDGWTALAALPWEGFRQLSPEAAGCVPPRAGDRWGFNVFRIKRPGGSSAPERDAVYAAWSVPDGPSFHVPDVFRDLVFEP